MPWFWTMIFLSFAIIYTSESKLDHHQKSSAVVVGIVYCDTCFTQNLPKASSRYFIAGASVVVECKHTGFQQQVKTDSHGEFKAHLPFHVSKHVRKIRRCSVRLNSSNKPYCAVAASATRTNLHRKDGTSHVFSAGFFTFRPQSCDEKKASTNNNIKKPSEIEDPAPSLISFLPPLPRLPPLPQLPRLPPLPGIPFLPPKKQSENQPPETFPLPPNPFNLPSIFPTNPFHPPPISIPPLFPSPNSPPLLNLPPIPGSIPPPSPPPPPPLQLPPFPFQPTPGFPGVPPAEVSAPSEKKSP